MQPIKWEEKNKEEKMKENTVLDRQDYFFTGFEDLDKILMAKIGNVIGVAGVAGIGVENLLKNFALNALRREQKIGWADSISIVPDILLINSDISERSALFGMDGVELQRFLGSAIEFGYTDKGSPNVLEVFPWEWERLHDGWWENSNSPQTIFIPNLLECIASSTEKKSLQDKVSFILAKIHSFAKKNSKIVFIGIPLTMNHNGGHLPTIYDMNNDNRDYIRFCDQIIALQRREYYDPLDKPSLAEIHFLKSRIHSNPILLEYSSESRVFAPFKPMRLTEDAMIEATHAAFFDV